MKKTFKKSLNKTNKTFKKSLNKTNKTFKKSIKYQTKNRREKELIVEFIYFQKKHIKNVLKELKYGQKKTHWIWYFFPKTLNSFDKIKHEPSEKTKYFSFNTKKEAYAFVNTPYLLNNYLICLTLLKKHKHTQKYIMDSYYQGNDSKKVNESKKIIKFILIDLQKTKKLTKKQELVLKII